MSDTKLDDTTNVFHIVPFYTRLINFILDQLIILYLIVAHKYIGYEILVLNTKQISVGALIYIMLFSTLYYMSMEFFLGKTISKFITRTHVLDTDGERPSFKKIFIRSLSRNLPFEAFSVSITGRWWHDSLSQTEVVFDQQQSKPKNYQ